MQLSAQVKHFIYIQNEQKTPFSVQVNDVVYQSTPKGFVTIPKLTNGKYVIEVVFGKNQSLPSQKFTITVADEDAGFTLKKSNETDWVLFDMLSFKTIKTGIDTVANSIAIKDSSAIEQVKPDSLQQVLIAPVKDTMQDSKTITDSVWKKLPVTSVEEPLASKSGRDFNLVSSTPIPTVDSSLNIIAGMVKPVDVKNESAAVTTIPSVTTTLMGSNGQTKKVMTKQNRDGLDQIYIDKEDTVSIFIPYQNDANGVVVTNSIAAKISIDTAQKKATTIDKTKPANNCNALASAYDFYQTRLDIAAATTEKAMFDAADRAFKLKCYTVEQVKNLAVLFIEEDKRLKFVKQVYTSISDIEKYSSLEKLFTQTETIEAFKNFIKSN